MALRKIDAGKMASVPCLKMSDGNSIPVLGLGTLELRGTEQAEIAVNAAIDAGYRYFDTAFHYENEKEIGDALYKRIADGTVKRDEIFITTKVTIKNMNNLSFIKTV
ncbi:hypothetical protein KUTeg_005609 [Tegillarca granosa]|uniref:NADP-dependent oxidoreductase domain-containing protein n=1 Tax=Tegillarca granosa TaxID=220873 RepID=A0ABQ9FK93_TEGGR|nr:hypothetical protein KUTeg_005609 [Tegillarca granosa]